MAGFNFGGSAASGGGTGFSFGGQSTGTTAGGFGIGTPTATPQGGLTLGAPSSNVQTPSSGFSFTALSGTPASAGGLSFTGTVGSSLNFGGTPSAAANTAASIVSQPGLGQPGLGQPGLGQPGLGQPGLGQPAGLFAFNQPANPLAGAPSSTGTALLGTPTNTGTALLGNPSITGTALLGTPSTATASPNLGGFNMAGTPGSTVGGFGLAKTSAPPTFSLGGAAATKMPHLGATTASSAGGFGLGAPAISNPVSTGNNLLSGLLSGAPGQTAGVTPGTAAMATAANTVTPAGGLTSVGLSAGSTGFSLGGSSGLKLGTGAAPSTGATGFGLGAGAGLKLGPTAASSTAATTSVPTAGFGLGGIGKTPTLGVQPSSTATSTATIAPMLDPSKQMSYKQLEEQINKWMMELEEQERVFLQQATQVNAWDRLLVDNGEKITTLNGDMERVQMDQSKLEQELAFIKSQQRELEELIVPMETAMESLPSASFQQHADLERENTYQLADNIDAQLKRMVQDLKEIIEHLNTTGNQQDNNDPVLKITKILNSHMDALQWVDTNTAILGRRVEDISKQMETQRKDQERNFRLVYD